VIDDARVRELRGAVRGAVVLPGDDAYDEARGVWNGMIDRQPALVVRCAETSDVTAAVEFGRSEGLAVAVRGGGHNVAGNATCDDGLVIDLGPMKRVEVDAAAGTARAQGGLTWGEFDPETQAFGLATTGGLVTSTGVAGFALGGGVGWLMRKHGLACDNMIGAELVTADGRVVRASEQENPDLLWGLRGGGGNFGAVVDFEFRLHPVKQVLGGLVAWPGSAARDVLAAWREWTRETPDELCTLAVFAYGPPEPFIPAELQGKPIVAIACCHLAGEDGAGDLRGLRDLAPPVDVIGPMPYLALQGMFDASAPRGSRNYWRSSYLAELTDEAIGTLLSHTDGIPFPMGALHIHQLGGAVSRVLPDATAYGSRSARFLVNYVGLWMDPAGDATNTAWVRAASDALEPYGTGARYVNFLADEGQTGARSAYEPATFARLQDLKRRYDPTNLFRLNQNVPPE